MRSIPAITRRQSQVLCALGKFISKKGYAPSYEEIGKAIGVASLASVYKHVTALERKGFIQKPFNRPRSLEITRKKYQRGCPLCGHLEKSHA